MSSVTIFPAALQGAVKVPSSKSFAQRALIATALAGGEKVTLHGISEDITTTQNALYALQNGVPSVNCADSAATLRLLIPLASAFGKTVTFTGSEQLAARPLEEYLRLLPQHGVTCQYEKRLPLTVSGQLQPGRFAVAGNVSSQYISGLLLALPLLHGDSEIVLTTPLHSSPYVRMTLQVLQGFGVTVFPVADGFAIPGGQRYLPRHYTVEGDWSQAAFFLAGGALGGAVTVNGLNLSSVQGDKAIISILQRFGAVIQASENGVRAVHAPLHGITVDVEEMPDLAPIIAVVAAFAEGVTVITGVGRLKYKESDRIQSIVANLRKAGITAQETPDGLIIIEGGQPCGAKLDGCRDHRIVMAMSILGLAAQGVTHISDADSVRKSYPAFFRDYTSLGGRADVVGDWE